jgi:N-acetylglucosamine kinase-like BadF-type ATPase
VALAADGELRQLARVDAGPANLRLVTDTQLAALAPVVFAAAAAGDAIARQALAQT